jgi:glycosyltransferase involved in cell wall biosynthesis
MSPSDQDQDHGHGHDVIRLSYDATAVPLNPVGAGRYTIDLARNLATNTDVDMKVWCRVGDEVRQTAEIGSSTAFMAKSPRSRIARLAWEQASLPRLLDGLGVDVHHAPHYTMPERAKTPVVVTVHDLTFFEHPEWHERSKVLVFRRAIKVAAEKAAVIVCVSNATADKLKEHANPRGRVVVVPHGVDRTKFHPLAGVDNMVGNRDHGSNDNREDEGDRGILERLGVRQPYVLFVGTLEPRKAVPDLVRAFDLVASRHSDRTGTGTGTGTGDLSLVIAGGRGWGADAVDTAVSEARNSDRIKLTGYVSDDSVPALMRNAAVVAYPAIEEGFGLPALEALSCGTPLVTTVGSVMAEVAGDAALLVKARDIQALADAIDAAARRDTEVQSLVEKGLRIAATHTWEASARGHIAAYRLAAGLL